MGCPVNPQQQDSSMEPAVLAGYAGHCFSGAATEQACSGNTVHSTQTNNNIIEQLIVTQCTKPFLLTDHEDL
jgi:hypothetical protein